jgi:hypothetical protein
MRERIALLALGIGLLATLGTACDDEPAPPPFPSSAFPSPTSAATGPTGPSGLTGLTGLTGGTGPTDTLSGPTGALPSPSTGSGTLTQGRATIRFTGDVQARATLTNLLTGVVSPPPGGFAVVWTAGGTNATTLGLGGGTAIGTQPTSPTLVLSLVAQTDAGVFSWTSIEGECDVTIATATATRFAGSLTCDGLASGDDTVVDVSATFQATG